MRKLSELGVALAAASLLLLVSGCGSDGGSGGGPAVKPVTEADIKSAPPTAQEHVSEMNDYTKAMNGTMADKAKNR